MRKALALVLLIVSVIVSVNVNAKVKKVVKKPAVVKPTAEQLHFEEMLPNTARVMFIDSAVVSKTDFLSHIPFAPDMGRMVTSPDSKLTTQNSQPQSIGFINEFDDTEIMAFGDSVKGRNLYMAHRFGKEWNDNKELTDLKGSFSWVDYPFLMADGVTLYYSAKGGDESFGGFDIYKTTYDSDGSKFYEPTNMGLPFSSMANDYFIAISDYDNLGWLVTDRRQPADKVCIYTFEPTQQRQSFSEDTPEDSLRMFAQISSIKDTWQFGNRTAALQRLESMKQRLSAKADTPDDKVFFVVNDGKVITSLSDFSAAGKKQYQQLQSLQKQYVTNQRLLDLARKTYADTPKAKRSTSESAKQIKTLEQQQPQLQAQIQTLEKTLRKSETK